MESPRPPTNTQPCTLPSRTCAQHYTPLFESYLLRLYRTDLKHWKSNDLSIFRKMYMIPERTTGPDRGLLYPFRKLDNRHIYKAHCKNRCVARPIKISQRQCPAGLLHCLNHASTCSKHVKLARRH